MIIDSHCHLDYSNLYNQLDDVVKRAEYNQVKFLLDWSLLFLQHHLIFRRGLDNLNDSVNQ